jgi:hypothetical protein
MPGIAIVGFGQIPRPNRGVWGDGLGWLMRLSKSEGEAL